MNSDSKNTILLVEDEVITAMMEKMQLEKYGYIVHHVTTGEKAIETILKDKSSIDIILMDIDLGSGLDGTQTAEIILKEINIPIVFLSSHIEPEIVEKTEDITSYGYVVKNSSITVLDASIKMAFKLLAANKKVTESNNLLTNLAALVPSVIYQFRLYPDGTSSFPYSSPGMYDIYEVTPDEVREDASKVYTRLHPEDYDNVVYLIDKSAKTLETFYCEFRVILPEKGLRWRWSQANPIKMEDGSILWHGIISDITERKLAELKLKESNSIIEDVKNKLDFALSTSNIGAWELDLVNHSAWRSLTHDNIFGYDKLLPEWTYEIFIEHVFPDDRNSVIEKFNTAISLKKEWDFEYRIVKKDGSIRWIWAKGIPQYDENEKPKNIFGIVQDISYYKNIEHNLQERTNLVSTIMETSPVGVTTVDKNGNITYANKRAEEILGLVKDEITSRTYDAPLWNHTDLDGSPLPDEKQPFNIVKKTMSTAYNIHHGITWPDGTIVLLSINASPMKDAHGNFNGMVATIEDVTEAKNNEKIIKQQLNEKEMMLKEVHHRIKNNISSIEGLLTLQADDTNNFEAKNLLKMSISRIQSMRILYDKLLISKKFEEASIKTYVDSIIDSIIEIFDERKNIVINKKISDFVINTKILFPIGIIINELFTNIYKYAFLKRENGTVSIAIENNENIITIIIHDDGIGIDERIYANKSPGFGLTIVKMLVEQLKGTCSMANDNGTKIVIRFEM